MQNEFIEELRKKARIIQQEDEYKKRLKREYPWLTDEIINKEAFEETLVRMFNIKGGEER